MNMGASGAFHPARWSQQPVLLMLVVRRVEVRQVLGRMLGVVGIGGSRRASSFVNPLLALTNHAVGDGDGCVVALVTGRFAGLGVGRLTDADVAAALATRWRVVLVVVMVVVVVVMASRSPRRGRRPTCGRMLRRSGRHANRRQRWEYRSHSNPNTWIIIHTRHPYQTPPPHPTVTTPRPGHYVGLRPYDSHAPYRVNSRKDTYHHSLSGLLTTYPLAAAPTFPLYSRMKDAYQRHSKYIGQTMLN